MRKRLFLALLVVLVMVAGLLAAAAPASAASGGKANPCAIGGWDYWDMSIEVPSGRWLSIDLPMVAKTDEYVQEWIDASEVVITLDGQPLPWEYRYSSWENTEVLDYGDVVIEPGTYPAFDPVSLHRPLRVGMHSIGLSWTLSEEVSDGWFTYDAGPLAETEISLLVTPGDEYPSGEAEAAC